MNHQVQNKSWDQVGLEGASFRKKAQALIHQIKQARSWIVPYPVDGLISLLQEGISNGKDVYEKNWCVLQMALLMAAERADMKRVEEILEKTLRENNGQIILHEKDNDLLEEINRLMNTYDGTSNRQP
jgi:hypothetical protein